MAAGLAGLVQTGQEPPAPRIDRNGALGLVEGVHVRVIDRVSGGCWTDPASFQAAAEIVLREAGYDILDQQSGDPTGPVFEVTVSGQLVESGRVRFCLATYVARLVYSFDGGWVHPETGVLYQTPSTVILDMRNGYLTTGGPVNAQLRTALIDDYLGGLLGRAAVARNTPAVQIIRGRQAQD